jgi:hypothetical protein
MRGMHGQRPKQSIAARSSKILSKNNPSSRGKCYQLHQPCKPKKRIRIGGKLCQHRPVKRYKLIKSCEPKKLRLCEKTGRPPKIPNLKLKGSRRLAKPQTTQKAQRHFKSPRSVKTSKVKCRKRKAYKSLRRIKLQNQKLCSRTNLPMMDADDPQECPSSDSSSLNLSEPVIVPRKPSTKRPMGFRALLFRLLGLDTKKRPKPPPFQF